MNYIGKFISNFKEAYNEINGATLTGAIDAVIVRQEDGSFVSSPFHVRFGKIGVLRSREKVVDIEINGEPVDIHMKLGETGEAFFVEEIEEGDDVGSFLGTSPLPNYLQYNPLEDDLRSQDSGVEAEEVICKSLKLKQSKDIIRKISRSYTDICDNSSCQFVVRQSDKNSYNDLVSDVRLEFKSNSQEEDERGRVSTFPTGSSPSVDVPKQRFWREELVRSKSLTSEPPFLQASNVVADGQGSKTDIEEIVKVGKTLRRRKKKRTNSKKYRMKMNDSHSSDNSTTSEIVDLSSLSVTDAVPSQDSIFVMDDLGTGQGLCHNPMQQVHHGTHTSVGIPLSTKSRHWRNTVSIGPEFHPFSDTDLSPPPSPGASRTGTPVKSDTEYEYEKQKNELSLKTSAHNTDTKWSWTWGELPTPPTIPRNAPNFSQGHEDSSKDQEVTEMQSMTQSEDAQRSMLGNMFSFMRATKKARHNPESEGIYLDDLNLDELDPEVAALYFPRNSILLGKTGYTGFRSVAKDDDVESGNGTSLPQSPHSVEGAIGGAKIASIDSDYEESARHPIFDYKGYHDLAFSLCGNLHEHLDGEFPKSLFLQSLVTYDDFCENPNVIDNQHLVVRFGGKYMNWATAASQIMALALFQRALPPKVIENLADENMPKKEIRKRTESKGYSWFSWGRSTDAQNSQKSAFKSGETSMSLDSQEGGNAPLAPSAGFSSTSKPEGLSISQPNLISASLSSSVTLSKETQRETYVATVTTVTSTCPRPDVGDSEGTQNPSQEINDSSESEHDDKSPRRRYKKTMRLSSDRIKKLNFRNGRNEVVFSVTTAYQGTTRCKCHVFLWNYDEKIVVSDIDGTITKSDVLGHILPIIGKDWAQGGVAQLFTKIKNNGYNFLYLSARAIGQARITREYLRSIKQGDVSLPDGPLLLNPTSLIQAFHREVIERKPEEFKISCLRDIKALFPANENPFYAGYGNRINDVWAYSAVGIPIQRIFTINHRGELKHELTQTFQTTYSNLTDIVNHMFPPANEREIQAEFSSLHFWKSPLPDVSNEIEKAILETVK